MKIFCQHNFQIISAFLYKFFIIFRLFSYFVVTDVVSFFVLIPDW